MRKALLSAHTPRTIAPLNYNFRRYCARGVFLRWIVYDLLKNVMKALLRARARYSAAQLTVVHSARNLIPSDEEIDKVVDAAAVVAGGVNPNSLSKFAKAATEAATTADGKKIGNLTLQGGKLGLAVGPGKITTATAAALDLFTAL